MNVNVAYACNDAYMMHTGISMISLFENNRDIEHITVYFIDMGISDQSKCDLHEITDLYGRNLIIIPFQQWESDLPVSSTGRHIKSVYAKIFFGRIEGIDRILYIDSDTVIVDSIKNLWTTDMEKAAIGGVQTVNTPFQKNKIGLNKDSLVINDGIVLMNLKLWREYKLEEKCIDFIKSCGGNPPVLSEGTINAVCQNFLYRLGIRYNLTSLSRDYSIREIELITETVYYSQAEVSDAINHPCIIHYVASFHERPWCKGSTHPFRNEYLKYKQISKWAQEPLSQGKRTMRTKTVAFLHKILPMRVFNFIVKSIVRTNRV